MKKTENNFAFIDSQNLHLSIRELGWDLDYVFVSHLEKTLKRKEPRKDGTLKGAFRSDLETG